MTRYNYTEPKRLSVFRSRDLDSKYINSHREVIPMGYVNSFEEFDGYVKMEYPKAKKVLSSSHRGSGKYYYTNGAYNIFYHEMDKLNTI